MSQFIGGKPVPLGGGARPPVPSDKVIGEVLRVAYAELGRLGNALNWDEPCTLATSGVMNAITNQYGTGVLDKRPDEEAIRDYLARATPGSEKP